MTAQRPWIYFLSALPWALLSSSPCYAHPSYSLIQCYPGEMLMYIIWLLPTFVSGCILRCISQLSGTIFTTGTTDSWLAGLCCGWRCLSELFYLIQTCCCAAVWCAKLCKTLLTERRQWNPCDNRKHDTSHHLCLFFLFFFLNARCLHSNDSVVTPTRLSWRLFVFVTSFRSHCLLRNTQQFVYIPTEFYRNFLWKY